MEKDAFINLLDKCWSDFRQQAVAAYPGEAASTWISDNVSIFSLCRRKAITNTCIFSDLPGAKAEPLARDLREPILKNYLLKDAPEAMPQSSLKSTNRTKYLAQDQRLRIRLGLQPHQKLISGQSLHAAVTALGLSSYSVEQMNDLVNAVAEHVGLHFKESSTDSVQRTSSKDKAELLGLEPVWQWSGASAARSEIPGRQRPPIAGCDKNVVPAQALLELLLADEGQVHQKVFKKQVLLRQFQSIREILLASDANQLVADLTVVRISDLAAPPEPRHLLAYFEPFAAIIYFSYGIMLAFQLDPSYSSWYAWAHFEAAFTLFLLIEIMLRMHLLGCRNYWGGPDRFWNWFDILFAVFSVADFFMPLQMMFLKIIRLCRLTRIVKDLRLKMMKELRLMIRGWFAGLRTIAIAFILLFYVIYMISALATTSLGPSHPVLFGTVPVSMFTAFRCYTGDCSDREGFPLTVLLAQEFGTAFVLCYVVSYMLVTMGIFNVILAVPCLFSRPGLKWDVFVVSFEKAL